jgi:2-polyprenyl-6-methoxyphenol hydroxylase-like FAD-dependent oxidoreductase
MLPTTTDVLVVGGGPTGLTAAVSLVARGREVTVIDNQEQGQNTSRASVVYSRTLEVLEPYGVAQRLASQGIHARRFTIRDRDRVLMNVAFDWLPTAYPYTLLVSQAVTESVLLRRLHQLGGRVLRPYTLTGLDQDASGVTGTFAGGERIRASYVVGADGTHSTVRQQTGIGLDASAAGASYSLADVHLSGGMPAEEVAVFFAPEGQLVCVPFPDGSYKLVANVAEARPSRRSASCSSWSTRSARGPSGRSSRRSSGARASSSGTASPTGSTPGGSPWPAMPPTRTARLADRA